MGRFSADMKKIRKQARERRQQAALGLNQLHVGSGMSRLARWLFTGDMRKSNHVLFERRACEIAHSDEPSQFQKNQPSYLFHSAK